MEEDVEAYSRYYHQVRQHTSHCDCSPIEFELTTVHVTYAT